MCNRIGDILGTLAASGQIDPIYARFDRAQLGMLFNKETIRADLQAQLLSYVGCILAWKQTHCQHDQIGFYLNRLTQKRILGAYDQMISTPDNLGWIAPAV